MGARALGAQQVAPEVFMSQARRIAQPDRLEQAGTGLLVQQLASNGAALLARRDHPVKQVA